MYISGASVVLFLIPVLYFVTKSELDIVRGARPITSYKCSRRLTLFLISNIVKHKHAINLDVVNFREMLSESHEVRAVSYDVLRRIVYGMMAFALCSIVATYSILKELGCF